MIVDTPGKQLLFSTVRIDNVTAAGLASTGTGFLLEAETETGGICPLLVTNKHVVANAARLAAHFIHRKPDSDEPDLGRGIEVPLVHGYVGHPDPAVDVAVVPIAPVIDQYDGQLFMRRLPFGFLATEVPNLFVDAIEEITFIGYPNGYYDSKHLTPVVRRGITATPLALDMEGTPAFLVDGSVFGGSSGSPVFLFNEGMYRGASGTTVVGSRLVLVGIIAMTMTRNAQLPVEVANTQHVKIAQELNLGVAFNARAIKETVEALMAAGGQRLKSADSGESAAPVPVPEQSTPLT